MPEVKIAKSRKTLQVSSYFEGYLDEDFIDDEQGRRWNKEKNEKLNGKEKNSGVNDFPAL